MKKVMEHAKNCLEKDKTRSYEPFMAGALVTALDSSWASCIQVYIKMMRLRKNDEI